MVDARTSAPSEASLTRLSVPVPSVVASLQPGLQNLVWSQGPAIQLRMPSTPSRVQLALPKSAWAVQVDEQGTAVDPLRALSEPHGVRAHRQGRLLFVYAPEEQRVQSELVSIDPTPRRESLERLYEAVSATPSQQRLVFIAQPVPRLLRISARCAV